MTERSKCDPTLGAAVQEHLKKLGVETPTFYPQVLVDNESKIERITDSFKEIWQELGMDLSDDSLCDTPRRMAKMYVNEIYQGLNYANFPKCLSIENKMHYDEMLVERDVLINSSCEHHGVTIWGRAAVAYIPNKKVLGLSKINRVVEFFCKRPQVQERLTAQIYHALSYILDTENIAVYIDAEHFCVKSRGIKDVNSRTSTSKLGGAFRKPEVRAEFFAIAQSK